MDWYHIVGILVQPVGTAVLVNALKGCAAVNCVGDSNNLDNGSLKVFLRGDLIVGFGPEYYKALPYA